MSLAELKDDIPAGMTLSVGDKDRRTYIGGSDIGALLGLDPYGKTPLTVYLAKIGELEGITDPEKKRFLERRKRWEGPIVAMLREEFDGNIVSVNNRYVDEECGYFAAEIDFEWADVNGEIQNGEIKTVSPFAFNEGAGWGEASTDQIPIHYRAQVMWGLGVKRRQTCIPVAMAGLDTMVFYRIERDDETIASMREVAHNFWQNHVLPRVPPAPISMADVNRLFKRHRGRPVELDDETAQALLDLRAVRASIQSHEATKAELELQVAKYICREWGLDAPEEAIDNAQLLHAGKVLCTWAAGRGAHLDQKRLAIDKPDVIREYTVPHHFRAFRFKKS